MQNSMWASRSRPISAAPLITSSRFTARAKALSFNFFRTDFPSTSWMLRDGFTYEHGRRNPESPSQANSVFSISESGLTPVKSASERIARRISPGKAAFLQNRLALRRMDLPIEIVEQSGDGVGLLVAPLLAGVGDHMLPQSIGLHKFANNLPCPNRSITLTTLHEHPIRPS